jgi:uncharacterized protein YifE (UPF0438 family)
MSYPALCPPNVGDIFSEPHTRHYRDLFRIHDVVLPEPQGTSHYGEAFHAPNEVDFGELPPNQTHKQYLCDLCSKHFIKPYRLVRHRKRVHGLSQAKEVISGELNWWQAVALIEMMKRKHMTDKSLRERLKEAVDVYERVGGDTDGYKGLQKYEEDVIAYARGFVQACTCADCGKVFSRKDAVARRHKCKT